MTSYQNLSDVLTKASLESLGIGHLTDYSKKEKTHCNEEPEKNKIKLQNDPALFGLWRISISKIYPSLTNKSSEEVHCALSTHQAVISHKLNKVPVKSKEQKTGLLSPSVSRIKITDWHMPAWYNLAWIHKSSANPSQAQTNLKQKMSTGRNSCQPYPKQNNLKKGKINMRYS